MTLSRDAACGIAHELAQMPLGEQLATAATTSMDKLLAGCEEWARNDVMAQFLGTRFMITVPVCVEISFREMQQMMRGVAINPVACNFAKYVVETTPPNYRWAALSDALAMRMMEVVSELVKVMHDEREVLENLLASCPWETSCDNESFAYHRKCLVSCLEILMHAVPIERWTRMPVAVASYNFALKKAMKQQEALTLSKVYDTVERFYQHYENPYSMLPAMEPAELATFRRVHNMFRYGRFAISRDITAQSDHPLYMAAHPHQFQCVRQFLNGDDGRLLSFWMASHVRAVYYSSDHSASGWRQSMTEILHSGQKLIDEARVACSEAVCAYFQRPVTFKRERNAC